jgi:hypothetical protein
MLFWLLLLISEKPKSFHGICLPQKHFAFEAHFKHLTCSLQLSQTNTQETRQCLAKYP